MRHPMLHRFLARAGPSAIVGPFAFVGLVATLAQSYPGVKSWGQAWFDYLEPVMTAPWFLVCLLMLILGYIAALLYTGGEKRPPKPSADRSQESPIEVTQWVQAESLELLDDSGQSTDGVRAINVALMASNTRSDGKTLRGLQARLHFPGGESHVLSIRNVLDPSALRHGELAVIDLGFVPTVHADVQAMFSTRAQCFGDKHHAENAKNGWRTLCLADATGHGIKHGIAQSSKGDRPFPNLYITITADDVPAKAVWLDMDLYKEKAWEWFTIKSEPTRDEE